MNKYVIGYLSDFDHELLLEIVEAGSEIEACDTYLKLGGIARSMQYIHSFCASCDSSINVIRID